MDINNKEDAGNAEIVLNKVTRIYSKGSDIEGLFTVKIDDETVYENEVGYITTLPVPVGDGIADYRETIVKIGETKIRNFFLGLEQIVMMNIVI